MGLIALIVLFLLIGLFWNIAPGKALSDMLSMTGAAGLVAGGGEPAAGFRNGPLPASQCGSCHAQHFEEWSRSFHAQSLTSEGFLKAFAQYLEFLVTQATNNPEASM